MKQKMKRGIILAALAGCGFFAGVLALRAIGNLLPGGTHFSMAVQVAFPMRP